MQRKAFHLLAILLGMVLQGCESGEPDSATGNGIGGKISLHVESRHFRVEGHEAIEFSIGEERLTGLHYEIIEKPAHGSVDGTPPAITYTPEADFLGFDSMTFRVSNAQNERAVGSVTFEVKPGNTRVPE